MPKQIRVAGIGILILASLVSYGFTSFSIPWQLPLQKLSLLPSNEARLQSTPVNSGQSNQSEKLFFNYKAWRQIQASA
ncbi:MAG: hypothetical protein A3C35_04825 [Omnitrophica bacterium RIFCSPHIGHO2_02_FULL_46_11]|nr:MAG: hypothetical protein A3C35_04825 [Omnitrophica bacterium RIFCSPHIGHO2_02_FULL_46_11]OGW87761.1 MAG: hypothetical protein A3A81_01515 [Omnitrophica bacterium RIFCSPLOWO2_01_FULL_45_10b]